MTLDNSPGDHTLSISGLEPATTASFRLRADADGLAVFASAEATTDPPPGSNMLPTPSGLTYTPPPGGARPAAPNDPPDLQWNWSGTPGQGTIQFAVSPAGQTFDIYTILQLWGQNPMAFSYTAGYLNLIWAGDWKVRARAIPLSGSATPSPWSAPTGIHIDGEQPPAPDGLSATDNGNGTVSLNWSWDGGANWSSNPIFETIQVDQQGHTLDYAEGIVNMTGGSYHATFVPLADTAKFYVMAVASHTPWIPYDNLGLSSATGAANPLAPPEPRAAPPAAPANLAAYLSAKDKVRLLWDNTPNNEDGFKVQKKLHTDSTWATVTTVGSDQSSTEITLATDPVDYTKPWDFRVISMKGGTEGGISTTASQSGIALQSVTFGGDQEIRRDNGTGAYSGSEWVDTNMNGTIDSSATPYSNGTIDDPGGEHTYAISYIRSVPAGGGSAAAPSSIYAGGVFVFNGSTEADWKLQGEGGGLNFAASAISAGGGWAWATLASNALPETIDSKNADITWKLSIDNGVSWFEVGTSKNHLYMTGAPASGAFETVLDLGCEGAKGKHPRNPGDAPADGDAHDREVVDGVWGKFSGNSTKRVDDVEMSYSHDPAGFGINAAEMLGRSDGRGQCTAWADLLVITLGAQGAAATSARINPAAGHNGFRVKLMPAQGSGGANYTVGTTGSGFVFHQVVRVGVYADRIYDPSYGGMTQKTEVLPKNWARH